jgi:hypothetical protein
LIQKIYRQSGVDHVGIAGIATQDEIRRMSSFFTVFASGIGVKNGTAGGKESLPTGTTQLAQMSRRCGRGRPALLSDVD